MLRVLSIVCVAIVATGCRRDATDAAAHALARADNYMSAGRFDAAALEYRNAIKAEPNNVEAYLRLAEADQLLGRSANAYRALTRASELVAGDPRPRIAAGRMLLASGQAVAAQARAELVLRDDPSNADALALFALARAAQRHYEEADAALRTALQRSPDSVWAHVALAHVLLATQRPDEALAHLETAIAQGPRDELAHRAAAAYFMSTDSPEEAEPHFVTAAAQSPQRYRSSIALADYYAAAGRVDDARAVLHAAAQNRALSSQHSLIQQRLARLSAAE
jgi:tetratricopeptide (TPR) repeat protein